jgi:glycosyltransferase involved in cell wall biosynthesis
MISSNSELKPLVSIIIPCYNQAHFLPDALSSVRAQTHYNWECIIINDGSPDSTEQVAQEWIKMDSRFRYIYKPNGGLSSARNAGLREVKGDYIQFLDADDVIHPDKFTLQINAMESTSDFALAISDYFSSMESDLTCAHPYRYLSPKFKSTHYVQELISDWETRLSIPVHAFLFKSALFRSTDIEFNESLPNHEDWDCWMNIFKLKPEVVFLDQVLAIYRIREGSMCDNKTQMTQGWLQAINGQKKNFDKRSIEYKLLKKRFFEEKYRKFYIDRMIINYYRMAKDIIRDLF